MVSTNGTIGIGICCGSSTVSWVCLNGKKTSARVRHGGDIQTLVERIVGELSLGQTMPVVMTGRSRQKINGYPYVTEPEALQRILQEFPASNLPPVIISFGAQTTIGYELDNKGLIIRAHSFGKCGSGTGEFLLQQFKRFGFDSLDKAVEAVCLSFSEPYKVASRCAVFGKSDCVHATNSGKATTGQVAAGLCLMIAQKIAELASKAGAKRLWLIGGGSSITPICSYLENLGYGVTVPEGADHFEAWGAALIARDGNVPKVFMKPAVGGGMSSTLPRLDSFKHLIDYRSVVRALAIVGEKYILSIDVGSTSTKMSLHRESDMAIVASYYGYTLGKPHKAILEGLANIEASLSVPVEIIGINVTGSGRYLAEAFLTNYALVAQGGGLVSVTNEIICHATAAVNLIPGEECTLFEVGGQDAKYTSIPKTGVPTDSVMNGACAAGTGSSIAEFARERFGISDPNKIAEVALKGDHPIMFGEQCSAFMEADISLALQQGASRENVMAGLCYSVVQNYINRVVGSRPIKGTILLQGGTAYNEAFCLAMAGVLSENGTLGPNERLVVSRDAGLMGAIGGALFLKRKMSRGEYKPLSTSLEILLKKDLLEVGNFKCKGCDYGCDIKTFEVTGENGSTKIPFGGFCRKYDLVRRKEKPVSPDEFDLVATRDKMLFENSDLGASLPATAPTIGILGNFSDLTYLPLFTTIFAKLGLKTVMPKSAESTEKRQGVEFCWPVDRSHGLMANLIKQQPDFFWLPHIHTMGTEDLKIGQCCPLAQGTSFLLKAAFPEANSARILDPYLRITDDADKLTEMLLPILEKIGKTRDELREAVMAGLTSQRAFKKACRNEGKRALDMLAKNPNRFAYVMVGRPYNAFSNYLGSNKGLARKLASMGITVIPLDFLPLETVEEEPDMYWSAGQDILRGTRFIAGHPQLYAVYLTNFSCGPDSFLVTRFREYLKDKPSLMIEFDGHTANAGHDTRLEAFTGIVKGYEFSKNRKAPEPVRAFDGSFLDTPPGGVIGVNTTVVIPDMGTFYAEAIGAAMESMGVRVAVLPAPDHATLALGRKHSSCKECLPYGLTLGALLDYLKRRPVGEHSVLFMPSGSGPCRFGQYNVGLRLVLKNLGIENVSVLSLKDSTVYGGLGSGFKERSWIALAVGSVMENIDCAVRALAVDPESARAIVRDSWSRILDRIRLGADWKSLRSFGVLLRKEARRFSKIPLRAPFVKSPRVLVTGEIYVRLSNFTTGPIVDYLGEQGIVLVKEPATNWFKYLDYLYLQGYSTYQPNFSERIMHSAKAKVMDFYEKFIASALAESGLCFSHTDDVSEMINWALPHISDRLTGEAIVTIGSARSEVLRHYAGVVAIGPFSCMPTRLASGILVYSMSVEDKVGFDSKHPISQQVRDSCTHCPFISYETDGTPLSPLVRSSLDAFAVVVKRTGSAMAL